MPLFDPEDDDDFNQKDQIDIVTDIMGEFQDIRNAIAIATEDGGEFPVAFAVTAILDQLQQLAVYVMEFQQILLLDVVESEELDDKVTDLVDSVLTAQGWYEEAEEADDEEAFEGAAAF